MYQLRITNVFGIIDKARIDIKVKNQYQLARLEEVIQRAKVQYEEILGLIDYLFNDEATTLPYIIKQSVHMLNEALEKDIMDNHKTLSYFTHSHQAVKADIRTTFKMQRKLIMYVFAELNDTGNFKTDAKSQKYMNLDYYRNHKYEKFIMQFIAHPDLQVDGYIDGSTGNFVFVNNVEEFKKHYTGELKVNFKGYRFN